MFSCHCKSLRIHYAWLSAFNTFHRGTCYKRGKIDEIKNSLECRRQIYFLFGRLWQLILKQLLMHIGYTHGTSAGKITACQSGGETGSLLHPSERGLSKLKLHQSCLSAFQSGEFRAAFANWLCGLHRSKLVLTSHPCWAQIHSAQGGRGEKFGGVPAGSARQRQCIRHLCTISGQICYLPPLGMGAGRAKTCCRTQKVSEFKENRQQTLLTPPSLAGSDPNTLH